MCFGHKVKAQQQQQQQQNKTHTKTESRESNQGNLAPQSDALPLDHQDN